MDKRVPIPQGSVLKLKSAEGYEVMFTVREELGRGGSFICYLVEDRTGFRGTLKEFYPLTVSGRLMHLTRGRDLSLVPAEEAFAELMSEGVARVERSNRNLREMQTANEASRNYFSYSRLCYGGGTVYSYVPADKVGQTYRRYLDTLSEQYPLRGPGAKPEARLINILRVMKSLSSIVEMLAASGYFSFDLTPDNFMVIKSPSGDPINDVVYLFDTDPLTCRSDIIQRRFYVPAYRNEGFGSPLVSFESILRSPELCYQADAYSVMALLYWSLTGKAMTGSVPVLRDQLLNAPLLKACKRLRQSEAYEPFVQRLSDLFDTTAFRHLRLDPGSFGAYEVARGIEILVELSESVRHELTFEGSGLDPEPRAYDADTMLANAFYKYPLYTKARSGDIRVLILGFGEVGRAAFRLALSAGQTMTLDKDGVLKVRGLHIAAVDKMADMDGFAASMPALKKFARVSDCWLPDGELPEETYADVALCRMDPSDIDGVLRRFPANYVLCCLGSEEDGRRAAKAVYELTKGRRPFIGLVCPSGSAKAPAGAQLITPVADYTDIDPELMNMAFNCHYLYDRCGRDKVRRSIILEGFRDSYNYQSDIANALHIKYKLNALGISEPDPDKAAESFSEALDRQRTEDLAYLEHRRWVANNIAAGYDRPESFDYIAKLGSHNDKARKLHPAMVPSERGSFIYDSFDWDEDDTGDLDPLDRTSVELYRYYRDHRRDRDPDADRCYRKILRLIDEDYGAVEAFQSLGETVSLVFRDAAYGADNFDFELGRFSAFLKDRADKNDPVAGARELTGLLAELRKCLFLRMEYLRRKENKSLDRMYVTNIPFILKFREFALFQDLLSGPGDSISAVRNALDLDAGRTFWIELIDCDDTLKAQLDRCLEVYKNVLSLQEHSRFIDYGKLCLVIDNEGDRELFDTLRNYVTDRCAQLGVPLRDIELRPIGPKGLAPIAASLMKKTGGCPAVNGFSKKSAFYEVFRRAGAKPLRELRDCVLEYGLSVREYLSLHGAAMISGSYSRANDDHRLLWGMYSRDYIYEGVPMNGASPESLWMWTCKYLSASRDIVPVGEIKEKRICPDTETSFISRRIELRDLEAPNQLLAYLVRMGVITDVRLSHDVESYLSGPADSFSSSRSADCKYELSFRYVTGTQDANVIFNALDRYHQSAGSVEIIAGFDYLKRSYVMSLKSTRFSLMDPDRLTEEQQRLHARTAAFYQDHRQAMDTLINTLRENKLLRRTVDGQYYFPSSDAEDLLTIEGALLEYFIYRTLAGTGQFSNVVRNVFFRWDRTRRDSTTNEVDVIAVKGKRALFVSAKSVSELENAMLTEIAAIADRFGAIPVLISGKCDAKDSKVIRRARDMDGLKFIPRESFESRDTAPEPPAPETGTLTKAEKEEKKRRLCERLADAARKDERLLSRRLTELLDSDLI